MKLPSGVKLSGPLIIFLMPVCLECRHARQRLPHVLLEMIPVILEQLELEIAGHIALRPGNGVGLIAAEHQAAHLFLEIGAPVGIADGGHVGGQTFDLFGDDILVLHRLQRHGDAGHGADLPGPLPAAIDHRLAGDRALRGPHRRDPAVLHVEARRPGHLQ